MKYDYIYKYILILSLPLTLLLIVVSYIGFVEADTYSKESLNWTFQATSQDVIDLFLISPFIVIALWFVYRKSKIAVFLWSGGILYIFYTFTIYCFDIHFNKLFLAYCLILGLSFYSLMYFVYSHISNFDYHIINEHLPTRPLSVYLLSISSVFILLWLSDIVPAILNNSIPKSVRDIGTFTNPVQVLDLAILLPGFIITAMFLQKRKPLGILLAPTLLTFCVLMDITIGAMVVMMNFKGQETNWFIPIMMGILVLVTIILLVMFFKNMYPEKDLENKIKYFYPLRS